MGPDRRLQNRPDRRLQDRAAASPWLQYPDPDTPPELWDFDELHWFQVLVQT